MLAVEHDHAGAGAEDRRAGGGERAQRIAEPLALDPERHHRRLAAGKHERIEAVEIGRDAHLARARAERGEDLRMGLEVALQGEHADCGRGHAGHYQPRGDSSCSDSSLDVSRLSIAWPRPVLAAATRAGSR